MGIDDTENFKTTDAAQLERIKAEITDSFDEELEMQLEEDRLRRTRRR